MHLHNFCSKGGLRIFSHKAGAIYLRLSREDRTGAESESIANQRSLLLQYAQAHHISVRYEFADDGITGTTQNRKSLQRMYRAIEDGYIGTVLVKDLSRLSRNFIHTGSLIEEWFPQKGVRLISVDDGIDTGLVSPSNDIFAIRAVLDDWYARDISRKVRAAIYAKQHAGFCTSASLPFGYYRNDRMILIHSSHALIVQSVFQQYEAGDSCCEIAKYLKSRTDTSNLRKWSDTAVRRMLMNTAYIGRFLLHKTEKSSYKSNRRNYLPASAYITYPIPPIISDQQFYHVQEMLKLHGYRVYPKHFLAGSVFCAVCGAPMHVSGTGDSGRAICSTRKRFQACNAPSVCCAELLDAVRQVCRDDGIPESETAVRRVLSCIRVSPEIITICLKYRAPKYTTHMYTIGSAHETYE